MKPLSILDRPIAFQRIFVEFGAGITGALFLSQCVYWANRTKDKDGWFYKTQEEWQDETGLSRYEQEGARKKLRDIGLIEEMKSGVPAKLYYRVDEQRICDFINLASLDGEIPHTGMRKTSNLVSGKPANIHTQNTTETTYKTYSSENPSDSHDKPVNKKSSFTDEDMRCAEYIAQKVDALAGSPGKHPMDSWANTIRLMRERDNRNHREICDLFKWANNDHFWKDNILSPEKLRKQWQKLTIRRNSERTGSTSARPALDFNSTGWADGLLDNGD